MLPVAACALGICLGLNFNVFILVPATIAVVTTVGISANLAGQGFVEGVTAVVLHASLCQVGYVFGITARESLSSLLTRLKLRQSNASGRR